MTKPTNTKQICFSVAPMMEWTDRHCRFFHRLLNQDITLYTEMVTTGALLNHPNPNHLLRFHESEHPTILQLGGSDPQDMAKSARIAADFGYEGININCGCPSERVQKGAFGACLMREPDLVAECVRAMQKAANIPVTIKCRIGIDDSDDYAFLENFIRINKDAGCHTFIVHARKAWLKGLSPKENREIPPLNYDRVYRLKEEHPDLDIHINGGIQSLTDIEQHMPHVDGIMIGRAAYHTPYFLREIALHTHPEDKSYFSRKEIVAQMMAYAEKEIAAHKTPLHSITRHMLGLFQGLRGARLWRQHLSSVSQQSNNSPEYVLNFLESDRISLE